MNDATNDATEFESSLDGAISFFQNLRRKLGALEQDASTQHDRLRAITASVAKLEQNQQIVALEDHLAEQARDLRNLLASVQILTQDARTLRDHTAGHESRLEQHHGQIGRLEAAVQANQEQLGQFGGIAETQYQHLHRLESALGAIDQNARSLGQVVDDLKTTLDRHDHALDTLCQVIETHETAQHQWREQQVRQDGFADSLDAHRRESQALQQNLAQLRDEFEIQRQALSEASQTRQDLQKQQDRLKHLETLIGKVSADTNSTRQILNILQSDLITQSDTLRELDQHWQASLAAYQPLPHPSETPAAEGLIPTAAPVESTESPDTLTVSSSDEAADQPPVASAVESKRLDELMAGIAAAQQNDRELRQALSDVQNILTSHDEHFAELRSAIQDQSNDQQERLDRFETALDPLRRVPVATETETDADARLAPFRDTLAAQAEALRQLQDSIQQQLQAQQEHLDQIETALAPLRDAPAAAPDLDPLRDALATQAEALRELRETAQQRATTLTQLLEHQQHDVRETTATVEELRQDFEEFRQALAQLDSTIGQQQHRFEAGHEQELELQRELASLQHTMTVLEERLSSQAQAFSGNFEQFRGLSGDIRNLEQQFSALESVPRRLNALEEDLIGREQSIAQLHDAVRQIREDSQHFGEALQQIDSGTLAGDLEARLNEQHQQFIQLNEAIDAIRTDAKTTQEKVVTMATNVAKRIFEFQNQLTATETAHADRLREAEQKLIQLQAALEIMETQRRPRRWFSMPAMFTHLMLTVGAAFLGVLATVVWTTT